MVNLVKDTGIVALVLFLALKPIYKIMLIGGVILSAWYLYAGRYTYVQNGNYRIDTLTGIKQYCDAQGCR